MDNKLKILKLQHEALRAVRMHMFDPKKGAYVKLDNLSMHYDKYIPTHPGIIARFVSGREDYHVDPREVQFKNILRQIDFTDNTVIFCFCEKGAKVDPHYHIETEEIYITYGVQLDHMSGEVTRAGQSIKFKPMIPHQIEYVEDTALIVTIHPPAFTP